MSALLLVSNDLSPPAIKVAKLLIKQGANINQITKYGQTPLTLCVINENMELARKLVKKGASMFNQEMKYRDNSPFLVAIKQEKLNFIELFCDSGANLDTLSSEGMPCLLYSFFYGHDNICMYLSLRVDNCDIEDENGLNIFIKYLMKKDI